jgi:hypothetical protein
MKKILPFVLCMAGLFACNSLLAQQDKSNRPSPPVIVTQETTSGAVISINYSQPSVKGRTIGKDLEPINGKIWRTGANEATVFETSKAVTINGKNLPAGKYALFTISGDENWTIILNKTWKQWGAFSYKEADDTLRVTVNAQKTETFAEKLNFSIEKSGIVTMLWGDHKIVFAAE